MDVWKALQPILKRLLFLALLPIYGSLYAFMNYTFKWWEGLKGGAK